MAKEKFHNETIKFDLNDTPFEFVVVHNLREYGLDLEAAFLNWVYRTKEYTIKDFCDYVMSKDPLIKCYPAENLEKKK